MIYDFLEDKEFHGQHIKVEYALRKPWNPANARGRGRGGFDRGGRGGGRGRGGFGKQKCIPVHVVCLKSWLMQLLAALSNAVFLLFNKYDSIYMEFHTLKRPYQSENLSLIKIRLLPIM